MPKDAEKVESHYVIWLLQKNPNNIESRRWKLKGYNIISIKIDVERIKTALRKGKHFFLKSPIFTG